MKRTLLLIAAFTSVNAFGQITVNSSDVVGIGDQVVQAIDTVPASTIQPGNAGANQSWDIGPLVEQDYDTLIFASPSWMPNANDFPNSNLGMVSSNGLEAYLIKTSSGLEMDGLVGDISGQGIPLSIDLDPNDEMARFPMNYQDAYTTTSVMETTIDGSMLGVDSLRVKRTTNKNVSTDAWGTITTPLGSFAALRVVTITEDIDSAWVQVFGQWQLAQNGSTIGHRYTWWSDDANTGFPVCELEYDSSTLLTTRVTWLLTTPTQTSVNEVMNESIEVYPNPAKDVVTIEGAAIGSLHLLSLDGRIIEERSYNGIERLDISNLPSGAYIISIRNERGEIIIRKKLIKQ